MLARKYRLPRKAVLHRKSHTITSLYFRAKIYSPEKPYTRFSVVVGKNTYKKAHDRNMLRRSIYLYLQDNIVKSPHDIVLIVLPKANELKTKTLIHNETRVILKKI